jgi:hypothetical protein
MESVWLAEPPDLGDDWADPTIVNAVRAGRLDQFLPAYRGNPRPPRFSQEQVGRWTDLRQSTIWRIEHGMSVTEENERAILRALNVPPSLVAAWGARTVLASAGYPSPIRGADR